MMYGIGWTYVIIAEIITTDKDYGLGHIMNLGQARGRTDLVFVSLITIVVFSKIFDLLGTKLIRRIFAWKYARGVSG
jgi:ABC-type nitrate/sulfonate/bicarbonate transport system permease component